MRRPLLVLLAITAIVLAGCGGGETSDQLQVTAAIDDQPLADATSRSPVPLDPERESTLRLTIDNPSDSSVDLERVRLEGELLGLNFLTYDVRVRTTIAAGQSTTLDVPLDFFDLEQQASGYLRAHVRTYDASDVRTSSNEFAVDIKGSATSTMNLFAYALLLLTVAGVAKNLRDTLRGRLPENRFHRGIRFLVPGLGFGLLLSVAFSVLRIFPLPAAGWVPLTLIPAVGAFTLGYLFTPSPPDDESVDEDREADDLDDDDLLDDLAARLTIKD